MYLFVIVKILPLEAQPCRMRDAVEIVAFFVSHPASAKTQKVDNVVIPFNFTSPGLLKTLAKPLSLRQPVRRRTTRNSRHEVNVAV